MQRLLAFGRWDGYRSSSSCSDDDEEMLWFRVKQMYMRKVACEMKVGCLKYWIVRIAGKVGFRIVDIHQNIVAEVIICLWQFFLVYTYCEVWMDEDLIW